MNKCKLCNNDLVIKIYRNKANGKQQGLYCGTCGKYHKFLTNDEVVRYNNAGIEIINTYGDFSETKLGKVLKDIKVIDYRSELYSLQKKLFEEEKKVNELEKELHYEKKRNQFITNILREYDQEKIIKEMEKKKCF